MRLQGARRRDDAGKNNLKSADDDAVCLHWVKGLCRFGDECAHKHVLPPSVDQRFIDLVHELRTAEAKVSGLRAARAPSDAIATAAARLRELQPQLRALQQQATPGKEGRSSRGRRRSGNVGRAAALQRFLFETYGRELLSSGCGLLDVAGGNCDFAWNALNWHGLPVTVVDPRPSLLPRRFARAWAHRMRDGKEEEAGKGKEEEEEEEEEEKVEEESAVAEVGTEEAGAEAEAAVVEGPASGGMNHPRSSALPSSRRIPKVPNFWPVYWRDELWRPVLDAAALTPQQLEEKVEAALHSVPASAASARRSRKADSKGRWRPDDHGNETTRPAAADGASEAGEERSEEEERSDDESEAMSADGACSAAGILPAALQCPPTVPAALEACRILRECSVAVGMHPDSATESIVDYALAMGKPFAVVPCCVCAVDFPLRVDARRRPVHSHAAFVAYLQAKDPQRIRVATLPFGGKNLVVYSLPSNPSQPHTVGVCTPCEGDEPPPSLPPSPPPRSPPPSPSGEEQPTDVCLPKRSSLPDVTDAAAPPTDVPLAGLLADLSLSHLVVGAGAPLARATLAGLSEQLAAGRPKLLAALKSQGVSKLVERQSLATALGKLTRGEAVELVASSTAAPGQKAGGPKLGPLLDVSLGKDASLNVNVHAASVGAELESLPALGASGALLPGEAESAVRPAARVRLICLYGAADNAAAFGVWARQAPGWLEVRAVELPGHGARELEGVWPMGIRVAEQPGGGEADAAAIAKAVSAERVVAISSLTDLIAPLCTDGVRYAIYGFSSGASA